MGARQGLVNNDVVKNNGAENNHHQNNNDINNQIKNSSTHYFKMGALYLENLKVNQVLIFLYGYGLRMG